MSSITSNELYNACKKMLPVTVFLIVNFLVLLKIAPLVFSQTPEKNDISSIFSDGQDIAQGVNPYTKIHDSDMRNNKKYSTYFPGFFLIVAGSLKLGISDLYEFLSWWRPLSVTIHLLVGALLFSLYWSRGLRAEGLFVGLFWLYNRWNLSVMGSGQIDLLAIGLLLLAHVFFDSRRVLAGFFFGCSLAIKQIAIILIPAFLLLWYVNTKSIKDTFVKGIASIATVPFTISLPFLLSDCTGFIKSVLFSATRNAGGHVKIKSLDYIFEWSGFFSKLPMFSLIFLVAYIGYRRSLSLSSVTVLTLSIFVCFNSVLLWQYFCWGFAFLPLALIPRTSVNHS